MNNILKRTKSVVFLVVFILSSCATQPNKVACPSFETKATKSKNEKNRMNLVNLSEVFSFKKNHKNKNKRMLKSFELDNQIKDLDEKDSNFVSIAEDENSFVLITQPYFNAIELNQNKENDIEATNNWKAKKSKTDTKINMKITNTRILGAKRDSMFSRKNSDADIQQKSERKTARIIGGSLLLMAVLAGISIPALGTLTASIGLVGVFLLDIMVSFGILKYHKKQKPKLAKTSSLLRLLYTAILGVGVGYLFAGSVPMFNKIWGVGLITFGLHLITLGVLFNNEGGKKWVNIMIKSLLIIAGIGYVLWYVGILVVPNPIGFAALMESIFILPMILGEVFYALWMLLKGGKLKN